MRTRQPPCESEQVVKRGFVEVPSGSVIRQTMDAVVGTTESSESLVRPAHKGKAVRADTKKREPVGRSGIEAEKERRETRGREKCAEREREGGQGQGAKEEKDGTE